MSKRKPRKKGQRRNSPNHSDLYTDENPKGTIKGLKFATVKDAEASVRKIKKSSRSHNHKTQAAIAMEQRAKAAGKKSAADVYRKFIEQQKKKTAAKNESSLRDYVRSLLIENAVSVSTEIIVKKFEELFETWDPPAGWRVLEYESDEDIVYHDISGTTIYVKFNLEGSRDSLNNFSAEKIKSELRDLYLGFAKRRGWNLLRVQETPQPSRNPIMTFSLKFDQQPNPKNRNYYMSTQELQEKGHVLLHLTKKKYLKSIMRGGFKPTKTSSDGINFGNGRAYFVSCPRIDFEGKRDKAVGWFKLATEDSGFAGINPSEEQVLLVIDPYRARDNIHFYVDTEFGYGSGQIGSQGWNGIAIWTPGHVKPIAIEEVIDL